MFAACFSTAPSVTTRRSAIAALERPSAISPSTSRSRGVSSSSGSAARPPSELGDDLGVQRRAARGHAAHGVDELARVADALLEQVAHAAVAVGEQLGGIARARRTGRARARSAGQAAPRLERSAHPLVGERRRHADVDHADVGRLGVDGGQERRSSIIAFAIAACSSTR